MGRASSPSPRSGREEKVHEDANGSTHMHVGTRVSRKYLVSLRKRALSPTRQREILGTEHARNCSVMEFTPRPIRPRKGEELISARACAPAAGLRGSVDCRARVAGSSPARSIAPCRFHPHPTRTPSSSWSSLLAGTSGELDVCARVGRGRARRPSKRPSPRPHGSSGSTMPFSGVRCRPWSSRRPSPPLWVSSDVAGPPGATLPRAPA